MKHLINKTSRLTFDRSFGLLLVRVATGLVFFMHGWNKLNNLPAMEQMLGGLGLAPAVVVFLAWLEVIGGLAMILGVATRFFGIVFAIEMLVAIFITGGVAVGYQRHELELLLMLTSLGLALAGSGRYSIFKMECEECGGMLCEEHKK